MSYIPQYIFILFFLITLDYFLGIVIETSPAGQKRSWLVLSIAANVLTLLVFKYFNFFTGHSILLPIGLSFHTMQSMSYVIEVSRGRQKAERNYLTYALYVMFFPQLVAGPIERPQNLLKQFYADHKFERSRAVSGLWLMAFGFYKKVIIADYISVLVNPVFGNPLARSGTDFIIAACAFSFQLFCDFSGYSDIARGAARVLGFELSLNFDQPFNSKSLSVLWNRWHISLSSWFRDYVYIPLGGNRGSFFRTSANIMLVFLLSGLWHGTGWGFIAWAVLNGLMVVLLRFTGVTMGIAGTFLYFSFTMIFFRSSTIGEALFMVSRLFTGGAPTVANAFNASLAAALIISLEAVHYAQRNFESIRLKFSGGYLRRWTLYYLLAVLFVALTYLSLTNQNEMNQPFIYFQF